MRSIVLVSILAGLGVTLAGCGSSGTPAVAKLGTTTASAPTTNVSSSGSPGGGSVVATGGGSGGKVGVSFSVAGTVPELMRFAACMRANGEPSFPDPNGQGVISAGSLDRGSPQFEQALEACRKNLGGTPAPAQQAEDLRLAIANSACMRQHGVPEFPDPQRGPNGEMVIHLGPNVDPSSPQFQRAQAICGKKVPGGGKG